MKQSGKDIFKLVLVLIVALGVWFFIFKPDPNFEISHTYENKTGVNVNTTNFSDRVNSLDENLQDIDLANLALNFIPSRGLSKTKIIQ